MKKPFASPRSAGWKRPREELCDGSTANDVRIIVHLDVDACYVACERELRPELCNRPVAVSQYNPYGTLQDCGIGDPARILYDGAAEKSDCPPNPNANGSMIAVSYEARARNVKRNDRGHEALKKCPELCIIQVPVQNGKANLTLYRDASQRLMLALSKAIRAAIASIYRDIVCGDASDDNSAHNNEKPDSDCKKDLDSFLQKISSQINVEKASIDEIYIDLSVPVQAIVSACHGSQDLTESPMPRSTADSTREHNCWKRLYALLTSNNSASTQTTIGGLETSQAAIAANSLTKTEIRKGSSVQVLDSEQSLSDRKAAWWNRACQDQWQVEETALAVGALITLRARQGVIKAFHGVYTLSAGVSTNKTMAKLASGLKKPNRQTLINPSDENTLQTLFHPLPLGRIRGLGGKLGEKISEDLQVKTVGELAKVPLTTLQAKFDSKQADFLYNIAKGNCSEEVSERTKSKSITAGKTFRGVLSFSASDHASMKKWLGSLLTEIMDRVDQDETRYAKTLTVSLSTTGGENRSHNSKSAPLPRKSAEKRLKVALELAQEIVGMGKDDNSGRNVKVISMYMGASNFVSIATGSNSIVDAFTRGTTNQQSSSTTSTTKKTPQQSEIKAKAKAAKVNGIASFFAAAQQKECNDSGKPELESKIQSSESSLETPLDSVTTGNRTNVERSKHSNILQHCSQLVTPSIASSMPKPKPATSDQVDNDLALAKKMQEFLNNEVLSDLRPSKTQPEQLVSSSPIADGSASNDDNSSEMQFVATSFASASLPDDPDVAYARALQASFDREDQVISIMEEKLAKNKTRRVSSGTSRSRNGGAPSSNSIASFFVKKS